MNLKIFLIPLLTVLAVTKVSVQSAFSKKTDIGADDKIYFNAIMCTSAAVIFMPLLFRNAPSIFTVVCGCIMGILSLVFQLSYISAFSIGDVRLTSLIGNFGVLIPIAVSVFFLGESFGILKGIGILFMLISLYFTSDKQGTWVSTHYHVNTVNGLYIH